MKSTEPSAIAEQHTPKKRRKGRPSTLDENVGREKIIATAIALLRNHKPGEITQNLVASNAGVDPKLVRYYFGDLEGLMTTVLERLIDGLGMVMSKASTTGGTATERIRRRIRALTNYVVANPNLWEMISDRVYASKTDWAKNVRAELTSSAYSRLQTVIEDGQRNGEFAENIDTRFLYIALIGLSEIFVTARSIVDELMPGRRTSTENLYADFIIDLVLRGIAKRP
ncbi:TetR/AcrR family transcriptional regulator [Cupriavidus lacunae]|uniref:TetR/AcrR family transcriptional regulator n=1 Tax=Cupriavidus lacunae TaxID=2666307 RepID=UPI001058E2BB|nr:TetR/AcrR family transcriptional regulator [Cupriavidus lacunae]